MAQIDETDDTVILEEELDPNYNPTQEEVEEYAKWLGMQLPEDEDLLYIAREGLKAPLPPNWKPCKLKDSGEVYYFNFKSGESSWQHPCDKYYTDNYQKAKKEKLAKAQASSSSTHKRAEAAAVQELIQAQKAPPASLSALKTPGSSRAASPASTGRRGSKGAALGAITPGSGRAGSKGALGPLSAPSTPRSSGGALGSIAPLGSVRGGGTAGKPPLGSLQKPPLGTPQTSAAETGRANSVPRGQGHTPLGGTGGFKSNTNTPASARGAPKGYWREDETDEEDSPSWERSGGSKRNYEDEADAAMMAAVGRASSRAGTTPRSEGGMQGGDPALSARLQELRSLDAGDSDEDAGAVATARSDGRAALAAEREKWSEAIAAAREEGKRALVALRQASAEAVAAAREDGEAEVAAARAAHEDALEDAARRAEAEVHRANAQQERAAAAAKREGEAAQRRAKDELNSAQRAVAAQKRAVEQQEQDLSLRQEELATALQVAADELRAAKREAAEQQRKAEQESAAALRDERARGDKALRALQEQLKAEQDDLEKQLAAVRREAASASEAQRAAAQAQGDVDEVVAQGKQRVADAEAAGARDLQRAKDAATQRLEAVKRETDREVEDARSRCDQAVADARARQAAAEEKAREAAAAARRAVADAQAAQRRASDATSERSGTIGGEDAAAAAVVDLQVQLASLRDELHTARSEAAEAKASARTLQQRLDTTAAQRDTAEKELRNSTSQCDQLRSDLEAASVGAAASSAAVGRTVQDGALEREVAAHEQTRVALRQATDDAEAHARAVRSAKRTADAAEEDAQAQRRKVAALRAQLDSAQAPVADAGEHAGDAVALRRANAELHEVEHQLAASQRRVRALEAELDAAAAGTAGAPPSTPSATAALSDAEAHAASLRRRAKQAEQEVEQLAAKLAQAHAAASAAQARQHVAEEETAALQRHNQRLLQAQDDLSVRLVALTGSLTQMPSAASPPPFTPQAAPAGGSAHSTQRPSVATPVQSPTRRAGKSPPTSPVAKPTLAAQGIPPPPLPQMDPPTLPPPSPRSGAASASQRSLPSAWPQAFAQRVALLQARLHLEQTAVGTSHSELKALRGRLRSRHSALARDRRLWQRDAEATGAAGPAARGDVTAGEAASTARMLKSVKRTLDRQTAALNAEAGAAKATDSWLKQRERHIAALERALGDVFRLQGVPSGVLLSYVERTVGLDDADVAELSALAPLDPLPGSETTAAHSSMDSLSLSVDTTGGASDLMHVHSAMATAHAAMDTLITQLQELASGAKRARRRLERGESNDYNMSNYFDVLDCPSPVPDDIAPNTPSANARSDEALPPHEAEQQHITISLHEVLSISAATNALPGRFSAQQLGHLLLAQPARSFVLGMLQVLADMPRPAFLYFDGDTAIKNNMDSWNEYFDSLAVASRRMLSSVHLQLTGVQGGEAALVALQQQLCIVRHDETKPVDILEDMRRTCGRRMGRFGILQAAAWSQWRGEDEGHAADGHTALLVHSNLRTFSKLLRAFECSCQHGTHPGDVPKFSDHKDLVSPAAAERFCLQLAAPDVREAIIQAITARRSNQAHGAEYEWGGLSEQGCLLASVCMVAVSKQYYNSVKRSAIAALHRLCQLPSFRSASKALLQALLGVMLSLPKAANAMSTLPAVLLASTEVDFEFVTHHETGKAMRQTAAMFCARTGKLQLLQLLAARGADFGKCNHNGATALQMLKRWDGQSKLQGIRSTVHSKHHILCWMKLQCTHGGKLLPGGAASLVHHRAPFVGDPCSTSVNAWGALDVAQMQAQGFFMARHEVEAHVESFRLLHRTGQAVVEGGGHTAQQPPVAGRGAVSAETAPVSSAGDAGGQWSTVLPKAAASRGAAAPDVISLQASHPDPRRVVRLKFHKSNQHSIGRLLDVVAEALFYASQLVEQGGFASVPQLVGAGGVAYAGPRRLDAYVYLSMLAAKQGRGLASDSSYDSSSVYSDDSRLHACSSSCESLQMDADYEHSGDGSCSGGGSASGELDQAHLDASSIDGYCRLQCDGTYMKGMAWMVFHQMAARKDAVGNEVRVMCGKALSGAAAQPQNVTQFVQYMVQYPMQHYCQLLLHQRNAVAHHCGYDEYVHDGRVLQAAVGAMGLLETLSLSGHQYFMDLRQDVCGVVKEWMHQQQAMQAIKQEFPGAFC